MAFQLAYGESPVLVAALTVAIQKWEARLADPEMSFLAEETTAQIDIAQRMLDRLLGRTMPVDPNAGIRALENRLGAILRY